MGLFFVLGPLPPLKLPAQQAGVFVPADGAKGPGVRLKDAAKVGEGPRVKLAPATICETQPKRT